MDISLNWLKDYIDLDVGVEELCEKMTMLGLEIEKVSHTAEGLDGILIGQITSIEPHPDADKLVICKTDVGESEPLQIVCGAKNMKAGDKVPTAVIGGTLPGDFKIARRKMRGIESQGMMCSAKELGLGDDHSGLMILDEDATIGQNALAYLGLDDVVLEIEVTPNRNDWAGMIGVARELSAAYDIPFTKPEVKLTEESTPVTDLTSVELNDPALCPRYVGRVIRNVKIGPSPDWLVQRLVAAGQRPINNVVDITNFVLMETGHPLHAFDYDKLAENRIVVRRSKAGESIKTIDQEEHKLAEDMLVIADAKGPVAVAGVMGGFDSEVDEGTTNLFVESAYFNPASIRKTSRALNIITESSQRFQRGADPEMAPYAADRACQLILELAGGQLAQGTIDAYPSNLETPELTLRYARTDSFLGAEIAPNQQRQILRGLGFEELHADEAGVTVRVPTWRPDVTQEVDLIEEVGRLFGFHNIEGTLPRVTRMAKKVAPEYYRIRDFRRFLANIGLTETATWTFSNPDEVAMAGLDGDYLNMITLENPLSEKHTTMQSSLIPGMLRLCSQNLRKSHNSLKLFEIAPVYTPSDETDNGAKQVNRLTILLSGEANETTWNTAQRELDFYDLKGYLEAIADYCKLDLILQSVENKTLTSGQSATIKLNGSAIGMLGTVAHEVRNAFEIDKPAYLLDINLDRLLKKAVPAAIFEEIPAFPPSQRDMALAVDVDVAAGDLLDTATKSGGKLLNDARIFDVYTGDKIEAGKKSVALSLSFQSAERTLTDTDTQKAFDKIVGKLKKLYGAELR